MVGYHVRGDMRTRQAVHKVYLRNTASVNNWDLVDGGCRYVIGGYLFERPRDILYQLAVSPSLWERRHRPPRRRR